MLSNLLGLGGLAALTYGTYVAGGEAPALFVGGFGLLLLGEATDKLKLDWRGMPRKVLTAVVAKRAAKRAAKKPKG